jgi:predicted aldo/keto reductase-like oxidoreductase
MSSVLTYGGAALSDVPQEVADRSIGLVLDAGINHFGTAAGYGESGGAPQCLDVEDPRRDLPG